VRNWSPQELVQVRAPKTLRSYCPRCKTHTDHSISLYKKGHERKLAEGTRRYARKQVGYGSQPKPIQKRFSKVTKKQTLRFKCKECGHISHRRGIRLKKLEFE